jgi:predicted TIM-barrel fold metal-dependent hydrolase
MPRIDTHAHVFHRSLTPIADARYVPDYDAPLRAYLDLLDRLGMDRGVLVQPSFLGGDNRFLLDCLAAAGGRLAGVVVIEEAISDDEAERMHAAGVRGVRFNLIGRAIDVLQGAVARRAAALAMRLGWHVELHADAADLAAALPLLDRFDGPIVVDHFGRPPAEGMDAVLEWAGDARVHIKLSAPYRVGFRDITVLTVRLLDTYGTERLLWGSDWPWTQHEAGVRIDDVMPAALGLDAEAVEGLGRTAHRLFFSGAASSVR